MKNKVEICHLSSAHARTDNRIFYKECMTAKQSGHDVVLVIADGRGNEVVNGIKIIDVGKEKSRFLRFARTNRKIRRVAKNLKSQVYHFHDPDLILTGFILSFKASVIYDIHENYQTSIRLKTYIPFPLNHLAAIIFGFWEQILSIRFFKVIAEKYYKDRFPSGIPILNYPMPNSFQGNANSKVKDLSEMKEDSEEIHLIYTGSLSYYRGAIHYARLLKHNSNIRITCVGECPPTLYKEMKENAGNEHFIMEGVGYNVPYEHIVKSYFEREWIAGLAIFPMSKHYFNKELTKFFEYMQYGIPIICSDFPVWKKLIEENECGICVDPENLEQQIEAIIKLSRNPDLRSEMGRKGKQAVLEKYSWDIEGNKLINLYHRLIT